MARCFARTCPSLNLRSPLLLSPPPSCCHVDVVAKTLCSRSKKTRMKKGQRGVGVKDRSWVKNKKERQRKQGACASSQPQPLAPRACCTDRTTANCTCTRW